MARPVESSVTTLTAPKTVAHGARLNLVKNNIRDLERTFDVADAAVLTHGDREAA